jgi:hypothetical protein
MDYPSYVLFQDVFLFTVCVFMHLVELGESLVEKVFLLLRLFGLEPAM